jgi:hypothetical protein
MLARLTQMLASSLGRVEKPAEFFLVHCGNPFDLSRFAKSGLPHDAEILH